MSSHVSSADGGSVASLRSFSAPWVAVASVLVTFLVTTALAAAWLHVSGAPALIVAAEVSTAALGIALVVYASRLREAEAVYRTIVETAREGIGILDAGARFTFVNAPLAEMLGYDAITILGRSLREFVVQGTLADGQSELRLLRSDGSELHVLANTSAIVQQGRAGDLLCMFSNLTPRAHAESMAREEAVRRALERTLTAVDTDAVAANAKIEELAAQVARSNEELRTFTYSVSHDLRAPLRAIRGFADELERDDETVLSLQARHYVQRIRSGSIRMSALIDSLLDLARASRKPLQRQQADVTALARTVASELQEANGTRAVDVRIAAGLTASCDPHLLRIVFDNLLGNAFKFTARVAGARIEVGCSDGELFVRDNGAGFDPRHAGGLFSPFQRLHHPSEFEGSGIGLATVRRIVERHGGRICATGAPGEGATFFFTLGDAP